MRHAERITLMYFTKKSATLLFVMNWLSLFMLRRKPDSSMLANYRGIPTHVCPCGSRLFKVGCMFEDNEISLWFTDAECALCGAQVTVPTPVDGEDATV